MKKNCFSILFRGLQCHVIGHKEQHCISFSANYAIYFLGIRNDSGLHKIWQLLIYVNTHNFAVSCMSSLVVVDWRSPQLAIICIVLLPLSILVRPCIYICLLGRLFTFSPAFNIPCDCQIF